jgi:hypothetical protein
LAIVDGQGWGEIQEDNPQPVEGVKEHGTQKQNLASAEDGMVVKPDEMVISLRTPTDQRGVGDVHQQKDEDADTREPMEQERPHAGVAPIAPMHPKVASFLNGAPKRTPHRPFAHHNFKSPCAKRDEGQGRLWHDFSSLAIGR